MNNKNLQEIMEIITISKITNPQAEYLELDSDYITNETKFKLIKLGYCIENSLSQNRVRIYLNKV